MAPDTPRLAAAPLQILLLGTLSLLLAVGVAVWLALRGPWLGLELQAAGNDGLLITHVAPHSPAGAAGVGLTPETHLHALEWRGERLSLAHYDPAENAHTGPTFESYNHFLRREGEVAQALRDPPVILLLDDGRRISLMPAERRPLSSLPLDFWLLHSFGLMAFLIGLSVWAFLPGHWPARLLALSGAGFFTATWQHSLWQARELALPEALFDLLMRGNHVALYVMLGALLVLLAIYPSRLRHGHWVIGISLMATLALQINENVQLFNLPLHSYYLSLLIYYLGGVALAVVQWHRARQRPLDRAALRWVLLSILLTMGAGMVAYFLPLIFELPPFTSVTTMVGLAVTLYLGFALGVLRYRLFQLERWWFVAWAWFLGGLSILLVDAAAVVLFGLQPVYALGLAVVIVGWVYFPVRQQVWRRLAGVSETNMDQHLPAFVEALYTSSEEQLAPLWRALMRQVFQPLALEMVDDVPEQSHLTDNGARLLVPAFGEDGGLSLLYRQNGRKLFSERDQDIAQALSAIAERVSYVRRAREAGANQERQRIMRDLHDDVGARLLTLLHTAPDDHHEALARNALGALRETIYALDDRRRYNLADLLEDWRGDLDERLAPGNIDLDWSAPVPSDDTLLTPRHYINLRRILDEAVTNALKHGAPTRLTFHARVRKGTLHFSIINDIRQHPGEHGDGLPGRGLNNMQTRIKELGGQLETHRQPDPTPHFHLEAQVQLAP